MAYAVVAGVSFWLGAWGPDALVRLAHRGHWPLLGIAAATPPVLGMSWLAGRILHRRRPQAWVWVWLAFGGVAGVLLATMMVVARTALTWLAEPGLLGFAIAPFPADLGRRLALFASMMAGVGSAVGLLGHGAVRRAGVAQAADGQLTIRSWAHLLVCVPIMAVSGLAGDSYLQGGSRTGIVTASGSVRERIVDPYTLHAVSSDPSGDRAVIDVVVDDGFAMRCTVTGEIVTSCSTVSSSYREWIRVIASAVASDEDPAEALGGSVGLSIGPAAFAGLAAINVPQPDIQVSQQRQYGPWVVVSAQYGSGPRLTCYFQGDAPVVLRRCRLQRT
jgi:hypothetical protein